jgi:hypothetical protein
VVASNAPQGYDFVMNADDLKRAKAKLREMELDGARPLLTPEQADEAIRLGWVEGVDFHRMEMDA